MLLTQTIKIKDQAREELKRDVERFLNQGGKIDVLPSEEIQPHNMEHAFDSVAMGSGV